MRLPFDPYRRNYRSLSVRDLLDARESYHVHLMAFANVFATAIGLYRIHDQAPDRRKDVTAESAVTRGTFSTPRTFANSVVTAWSWPCVLVFVRQWMSPHEVRAKPDDVVPPFLYLPDGRVVPVCVVCADLFDGENPTISAVSVLSSGIGPGFPVLTQVQERDRVGTIACIVKDADRYYALTARHVVGPPGTPILSAFDAPVGQLRPIGAAAAAGVTKRPFELAYPGLPGARSVSNLDVGLVEMSSLRRWSSDMREIGPLGPMVDFNAESASLDWIRRSIVGFGAASHRIDGEIWGLFYRYLNVAGVDYIADFLIGGREGAPLALNPGDSGTLLCITPEEFASSAAKSPEPDPDPLPRPFGIVWGGQKLVSGTSAKYTQFGLATSLATACRELDVELVTDWQRESREYWGQVGHYKIAELSIALLPSTLRTFFSAHAALITFPGIDEHQKFDPSTDFVPLADVPDIVWKSNINRTRVGVRSSTENPNHYADIDLSTGNGKQAIADLALRPEDWQAVYEAQHVIWQHQGLLPFRIWQIFDDMVEFVRQQDTARFLCAAGILAHYVGDACQPLHGSKHADGLDGSATGVHTTYEDRMVDDFAPQLAAKVSNLIASHHSLMSIKTGQSAATHVRTMMKQCQKTLPPTEICRVYNEHHTGGIKRGGDSIAAAALFQEFGDATAACIARGIRMLASLWSGAYHAGNGRKSMLVSVTDTQLRELYNDKTFLPSYSLTSWIQNVQH